MIGIIKIYIEHVRCQAELKLCVAINNDHGGRVGVLGVQVELHLSRLRYKPTHAHDLVFFILVKK